MGAKVAARYGDSASVFIPVSASDTVYLDIDLGAEPEHWIFLSFTGRSAKELGKALLKASRKVRST